MTREKNRFFKGNLKYLYDQLVRNSKSGKSMATAARIYLLAAALAVLIVSISYTALLLTSPRTPPKRSQPIYVACVGDSITQLSNYPADLQAMLGDEYTVGNFGVAGAAVSTHWFKPYVDEPAFQESMDFGPSVVIILLGTNDAHTDLSTDTFNSDYVDLITAYENLESNPTVIIVKPPPIYENNLGLDGTKLDEKVIPEIEQVAENLNLTTVDVNNALTDHPEFFQDGVHPNDDGALAIANEINDALDSYDFSNAT